MNDGEGWRWLIAMGLTALVALAPHSCHISKTNGWHLDVKRERQEASDLLRFGDGGGK